MSQQPTPQDIEDQLNRLSQYRSNVQTILQQISAHGGKSFASISELNALTSSCREITRCKAVLRGWGLEIQDMPDDDEKEVYIHRGVVVKQTGVFNSSYKLVAILLTLFFLGVLVVARSIIGTFTFPVNVSPSVIPVKSIIPSSESTIPPNIPSSAAQSAEVLSSTSVSIITAPSSITVKYGVVGQGERQTTLAPPGVCALYFYVFLGQEKTFFFRSDSSFSVNDYNGTLACWPTLPNLKDVGMDHPFATIDEVLRAKVTFSENIVEIDPRTLP